MRRARPLSDKKKPSKPPPPPKTKSKKKRQKTGPIKCPVWVKSPNASHPELDKVLERPFLSAIFFNPAHKSFGYPVPGRDKPHVLGGLHNRLRTKFFGKRDLPKVQNLVSVFGFDLLYSKQDRKWKGKPLQLPSSKGDGSKADKQLEAAIAKGAFPDASSSDYARSVWEHWASIGHVPILSQLPVVLTKANVCTAGDYFTRCEADGTLHLWELKTGWPLPLVSEKEASHWFSAPLDGVKDTPQNRWQLQVEMTRIAYEREMGMKIDACHVIHAWLERRLGYDVYATKVKVLSLLEDLDPPGWPTQMNLNAAYDKL